jgi:Na+/melibiose symporter-like transporter
MGRKRKAYPEDAKTMIGLSTLGWTETIGGSFIVGMFMLYLTDYANIGAYAATLGTILLMAGKIVDMIDDPLQGWIMDRSKPTKIGKYKPFIILSIIMITVSMCCLFAIPQGILGNQALVSAWVIFFYLLYDMGTAFNAQNPLKQSLTTDPAIRAKHITWPRVITMIVVIPVSFFIPMLTSINEKIGNMSKSFSLLAITIAVIAGIFSLIGIALVKEGKHMEQDEEKKVSFADFKYLFINNKPYVSNLLMTVFHGFVWTMVFATTTYYVKWAYCTDLSTGVVDQAKFGSMTLILGMFQLFPSMLGALVSPKLVKLMDGPVRVMRLAVIMELVGGLALFICMILGILNTSPAIYFICIFVLLLGSGITFVPGSMMGVECMDYTMVKTGKEIHGIVNSVMSLLSKIQSAVSTALVGLILISIGYEVDSVTDTFLGDLNSIPTMLNRFIIVCGLIPAILCAITLVFLKIYPIDTKMRNEINEKIAKMR